MLSTSASDPCWGMRSCPDSRPAQEVLPHIASAATRLLQHQICARSNEKVRQEEPLDGEGGLGRPLGRMSFNLLPYKGCSVPLGASYVLGFRK